MTKRGPREPAPLALILPLLVLAVLLGWAAGPASGLPQSGLPILRQRREAAAARAERGRVWTAEDYRLEPEVAAAGLAAARALVERGRSDGASAAAMREEEELEPHTAAAAKYAAGLIHEWLGRDRPAGVLPGMDKERMLLLDNVLAAVLRNVYKHHRQLRRQRDRLQIGNELPDDHHHHQRHEQDEEEEDGASSSEMEHLLSLATQRPRLCTTPELCRRVIGQSVEHQRPALNYAYQPYRPQQQQLEEQQPRIVHALGPSKRNRPVPKPQRLQKSVAVRQPSALSTQVQQQKSPAQAVSAVSSGLASQFLMRNVRGNRQYDVPQIECPTSDQGMERFACPSPDFIGRYRCIDDNMLCDGFRDCPQGEDEDRQGCLFYKTTKAHLDVLADALLRWVRGRRRR